MTEPLPTKIAELRALLAAATAGPWYHYDEVFRPQFSQRRITEIQRAKDGMAIIKWGGFDGLDGPVERKKNANAALIVALRNNADALLNALQRQDEPTAADYEEVLTDHRRLVRELDVALNGEDAAQQASLCDIVGQVRHGGWKLVQASETPSTIQDEAALVDFIEAQMDPNITRGFYAKSIARALIAAGAIRYGAGG